MKGMFGVGGWSLEWLSSKEPTKARGALQEARKMVFLMM